MIRRDLVVTLIGGTPIETRAEVIEDGTIDIYQKWTDDHGRAANSRLLIATKDFPEFIRRLQMLAAELPS